MITKVIKQIPLLYKWALSIKHSNWNLLTKQAFTKYVAENKTLKLQLGSGHNVTPGWFNTDYFPRQELWFLNVVKPFPFPDNSFDFVFSEHHIEHITYKQAIFMLGEVLRVMKPGGYFKIITPDLQKYIGAYGTDTIRSPDVKKQVDDWIYHGFDEAAQYVPVNDYYQAHFVNDIFLNYQHRFIYDELALKSILVNAGFENCKKIDASDPADAAFQGINAHKTTFNNDFSLFFIAQKKL